MKAPRHRFRIIRPGCRHCQAPGAVVSTHTTLNAAKKERQRLLSWVGMPEPLHVQQWSVSCRSWQRPDQCKPMKPTQKIQNALDYFQQRIRNWQPGIGEDKETRDLYTKDRKDMRAVLSACRKGEWQKAAELTYHLDTILRDEIPKTLWDLMHE